MKREQWMRELKAEIIIVGRQLHWLPNQVVDILEIYGNPDLWKSEFANQLSPEDAFQTEIIGWNKTNNCLSISQRN